MGWVWRNDYYWRICKWRGGRLSTNESKKRTVSSFCYPWYSFWCIPITNNLSKPHQFREGPSQAYSNLSKLSLTKFNISSVLSHALAGSLLIFCHRSPCLGSAFIQRCTNAFWSSGVPCCYSNLYHCAHTSPMSGFRMTARLKYPLAFSICI